MCDALNSKSTHHESFFRELNFSTQDGGDGFDKVAEYFGQNVFSSIDSNDNNSSDINGRLVGHHGHQSRSLKY